MAEFVIRGAGEVLARHRKALDLTLEALATKAGLDKSQIAKYESNKVGISDQKLTRIAVALGVPPQQLALECLIQIKPHIQSKPIGRLLGSLVLAPAKPKTSVPRKRKPASAGKSD